MYYIHNVIYWKHRCHSPNNKAIKLRKAPDWKKKHRADYRCPRGASLGIMEGQLRTPLKLSVQHSTIILRALRGVLNRVPIMPRDVSLSDSQRVTTTKNKSDANSRAFRPVIRSLFVFTNRNCYWLNSITWYILVNHSYCWRKQKKIELHVERLY